MFDLQKFNIKEVKGGEDYAFYEVGPLPSGYGVTVGNILRRILLSSIPGAAITSVKINGVKHEYSTLSGVNDDILMILMNIKKIAVKTYSEEPQVIKLSAKGKGVVKAGDFTVTSDVEISNPDQEITELTAAKTTLDIEATVEGGVGYSFSNEDARRELGVLPVDSNFNPVIRVSSKVATTRVGQETNLDKINLEVYTNGSVKPWDAMVSSIEIFSALSKRMVAIMKGEVEDEEEELAKEDEVPVVEKLSIDKLNLSTRLYNSLKKSDYNDLMNLQGKTKREIYEIKGMGEKSSKELFEILKNYNIDIIED